MTFLQKKLWLAWSKFRFLRLPIDKRVRLEVTTDGRHLTFILVSLYEAGYGVQAFGGGWIFRELMLLRKVAPIPFLYGGPDVECGLSISDRGGKAETGKSGKRKPENPSTVIHLDYDYFSGLTTKDTNAHEKGEAGLRPGSRAGAAFSNPSTSELARDSENTSPNRSAFGPASALRADDGAIGSDGGNQLAKAAKPPIADSGFLKTDGTEGAKELDTRHFTLDTASPTNAGNSRSETSGVFVGPSASSLGSGPAKTPPAREPGMPASASSFRVVREFRGEKSEESKQVPCSATVPGALRAPYFMHPSVYHRGLHKGGCGAADSGGLIADGGKSAETLDSGLSSLDSAPEAHALDSRRWMLDSAPKTLRMPYFMQPGALHGGFHKIQPSKPDLPRRIRVGFYGTHHPEYYTKYFRFPILPRTPILDRFIEVFSDQLQPVETGVYHDKYARIAVSIDKSATDQVKKTYLSKPDYFSILEQSDFLLCPPGWCMPQSHNIVECMSRGVIPILNYADYMVPALVDGENCLAFSTLGEMERQVRKALEMPLDEIQELRISVIRYYKEVLAPGVWLGRLLKNLSQDTIVLVNHEADSIQARDGDFLVAAAEFIGRIPAK